MYLTYLVILPKAILGATLQMYQDDNNIEFSGYIQGKKRDYQLSAVKLLLLIAIPAFSIAPSIHLIWNVLQQHLEKHKTIR